MKKLTALLSVLVFAGCGSDGADDQQTTKKIELTQHTDLVIDLGIHNYAPASLADVNIQLFLPMTFNGIQTVNVVDDSKAQLDAIEGSLSVLKLTIGDMAPRASDKRQLKLQLGYQDQPLPLDRFQPLEVIKKEGQVEEIQTADEIHTEVLPEPDSPKAATRPATPFADLKNVEMEGLEAERPAFSKEEEKLIAQLQSLQEKGDEIYVFEGIVCERQKICHLTEKTVWFERKPTEKNEKQEMTATQSDKNQIRFIYDNLKTYEQIRQAFISKKQFILSSAVVEIQ